MDDKPTYKVIDSRGRITIPQSVRDDAGIKNGDVVELIAANGDIQIRKVEVIHIDNTTKKSIENTVYAALRDLDPKSLIRISKKVISLIEKGNK